jgi:multiple sugar transport system ATP-binding protein
MAEIRIERITKRFAGVAALADVSLTVRDGEFMVLLGPSGCGKTTLLRTIAGLEDPDEGAVVIDGQDVTDVAPGRRGIAMVFQSYALFPHLKVGENIAFGLRMHQVPSPEVRRRVTDTAEMMHIGEFLARYPIQLSGGQRQRVAVARALVMEPSVILMDEPLSNLDALMRSQVRAELKRLLQEVETTTVYVTHDQSEALSMGDRIAVMRDGRILQVDLPATVYDRPADVFVAQFIGTPGMNVLRGWMSPAGIEVEGHRLPLEARHGYRTGEPVTFGVRAENVEICHEGGDGRMPAEVTVVELLGTHLLLTLALGTQLLRASTRIDFAVARHDRVWVRIDPASIRLIG